MNRLNILKEFSRVGNEVQSYGVVTDSIVDQDTFRAWVKFKAHGVVSSAIFSIDIFGNIVED